VESVSSTLDCADLASLIELKDLLEESGLFEAQKSELNAQMESIREKTLLFFSLTDEEQLAVMESSTSQLVLKGLLSEDDGLDMVSAMKAFQEGDLTGFSNDIGHLSMHGQSELSATAAAAAAAEVTTVFGDADTATADYGAAAGAVVGCIVGGLVGGAPGAAVGVGVGVAVGRAVGRAVLG